MARSERTRSPRNGGASAGQRAVRSRPRSALRQDQPAPPDQAEFVLCEQTIFGLFQERWTSPLRVDRAHNTYLEHAAELGLLATAALYLEPVLLFAYCVRGVFARRKDQVFPLVAACATVLVAVHALVYFGLQIPAVAVTYAAILGTGVAQGVPSARKREPGASLRG